MMKMNISTLKMMMNERIFVLNSESEWHFDSKKMVIFVVFFDEIS